MADYKNIIPFILEAEGGLSKSKADTASNDPVPDGSGHHTNKGITWTTFKNSAPKCGFIASPELFYSMPDYVWEMIFKKRYWDKIMGDQLKFQSIADTWVDWAWGSGPGTAIYKMQEFLSIPADHIMGPMTLLAVNGREDEKIFNDEFSAYKLKWYLSLPHQDANYKGWEARLTKLHGLTDSGIQNA